MQQLEMQQAEQRSSFSSAMADVNGRSSHLQQEVAAYTQQLQQEQSKADQLSSNLASVQAKTALLGDPSAVASTKARYCLPQAVMALGGKYMTITQQDSACAL